ncbi:hypothetical protein DPMN_060406 [Dreissena polymorpha]|uniref:Uncharacterized protein n=1 Tax=Dreissena polymorpha TaxID=45954 RepID=A0A9D4C5W2_DREPO|nr:hypothetical protein DPMN_060406 [Dreissena polymorpha]
MLLLVLSCLNYIMMLKSSSLITANLSMTMSTQLLAVVQALQSVYSYLYGQPILRRTDNAAVKLDAKSEESDWANCTQVVLPHDDGVAAFIVAYEEGLSTLIGVAAFIVAYEEGLCRSIAYEEGLVPAYSMLGVVSSSKRTCDKKRSTEMTLEEHQHLWPEITSHWILSCRKTATSQAILDYINVISRALTRKTAPPPVSHVFQRTGTIFKFNRAIIRTNLRAKSELSTSAWSRDVLGLLDLLEVGFSNHRRTVRRRPKFAVFGENFLDSVLTQPLR